ncbi:MAG: response regulator transcription factor [Prevotella sp.]|nr:response regulator transcription factor [Prevotella sp.]
MTCIIVDDEPLAVKLLESFVSRTEDLELVASFTDSVEAISMIKSHPVDLLFLDIQMPDMNGMELAHMIPSETRVIFTTAFKEYAFESYEVNALDFLLKPIRYNKFLTAVDKARQWFALSSPTPNPQPPTPNTQHPAPNTLPSGGTGWASVFLRVDGEYRQVNLSQVLYVSGMKDYVMFYLEGERRPLITHLTMKAVEDMLPQEYFMRVHRSYIVALDKIRSVDRNDCIYIGDEVIRVTDAYRDAFIQYLQSKFPGK